jgi:hypothetical protein
VGRDGGQFDDFKLNQLGGILCDALFRSNNDGDRFADVPDFFTRYHGLPIWLAVRFPMLSDRNDRNLAYLSRGDDGSDSLQRPGSSGFDFSNSPVGNRTSKDHGVKQIVGLKVTDKRAGACE